MKLQKQILINAILFPFIILLTMLSSQVKADEKQWVVFRDNIPQEVERINIVLEYAQSGSLFYNASQNNIKTEKIEGGRKKDEYKQQFNLGTTVDGNQYVVMVRDATDMSISSTGSDTLCMAKVLRARKNKKYEVVKEGLLSLHRELMIPLEVSPEQISVPFKKPVAGVLRLNIHRNNGPVYEGRCRTTLDGTLSGSTSVKKAFLNASITCKSSLKPKERLLNLSLKPFDDQMVSASCSGKISGELMLGSAKLVVEKMTSNSSELVLALLGGNLEPVKKQDHALVIAGKPFPTFARVELVKRQLLTLDDLKKKANADGYVVLIFGDFKRAMPGHHGGRLPMQNLSLGETMISDILKKDSKKPIVICFVCQQLSLSDLYEKWIGCEPEFYVLSDFSNPLNIQFVGIGMDQHRYHRPDRGETLRGKLRLKNEKVITVLIDGDGNVVYLNMDAGNALADSLVQINNLMKKGKTRKNTEDKKEKKVQLQ
ncbi:MAG: hypothetical protein KAT56_03830 [Sedimentisphaerales bacterium]|nr:hypothetical protein [Sedimentisphaerales bacterium]